MCIAFLVLRVVFEITLDTDNLNILSSVTFGKNVLSSIANVLCSWLKVCTYVNSFLILVCCFKSNCMFMYFFSNSKAHWNIITICQIYIYYIEASTYPTVTIYACPDNNLLLQFWNLTHCMTSGKQYRSTYYYSGFEDNDNTTCLNLCKREHFVIANKVLVSSIWMVLTLALFSLRVFC